MSENALDDIREMWRKEQCDACREHGPGACTATEESVKASSDSYAWIIDEHGNKKFFCFIGCMMLQLSDAKIGSLALKQWDKEGEHESFLAYNEARRREQKRQRETQP